MFPVLFAWAVVGGLTELAASAILATDYYLRGFGIDCMYFVPEIEVEGP